MRIPWYLVVIASIGTIALTWYLRTKEMNFLEPQGVEPSSEDFVAKLSPNAGVLQPEISDQPLVDEPIVSTPVAPEPEEIEFSDKELGDLEISPGLDEYRDFALANSPERLFELSSVLRAKGQFQRALLAFERVVDTASASPKELAEAANGIAALSPTLPPWFVDPGERIVLEMKLETARAATDGLKKAALEVATIVRESSGDLLEVTPKLINKNLDVVPVVRSVALSFSAPEPSEKTSEETGVLTFRLPDEENATLNSLALAIVRLIRGQLEKSGYPEFQPLELEGSAQLATLITRQMWADFSKSYGSAPAPEADEDSDENDSE